MKKAPLQEAEQIEFCDLSSDLDQTLTFLAFLSQEVEGYSDFLYEYLGKRAALEHVFFRRYVGKVEWDDLKLKAEIWRIQKVRAKLNLRKRSVIRSNRSG